MLSVEVPGIAAGAACEITSVVPSSANSIPSVTTNEAIPTTATKNPLIVPISMQTTRVITRAGTSGRPAPASFSKMNGDNR